MGDFNSVLKVEDKVRGNPISMGEIMDFHNYVEDFGLIELPSSGSRYTWNNRHRVRIIIFKIDWVLINSEWLNSMPDFRDQFLPEGISDLCPVKLSNTNAPRRAKAAFKYCNVCSTHSNFLNIVHQRWKHQVDGCCMFKVVKKLKMLKQKVRSLNMQYFKNIIDTAEEDKVALAQPLDVHLQQVEKEKFMSSHLAETYLQQRSKVNWIKLGDDNTRYFFIVIKHRKLQQGIVKISDKQGRVQADQKVIATIFMDYYQELLGHKEQQRARAFNTKEVKDVMFSIKKNKSPGPDEYESGFFKAAWSIIGEKVTDAILEFFENG
uniref:Uncharacterized protein n=1 Tax=Nicotiana tabacum TaxID=4097 RepID=A0A1S4BT84_TOBAC|nr:PREDICTED: uncharacterized protein LOC107811643 [Nicotiana tabacum]